MPMHFVPLSAELGPAIRDFNERMNTMGSTPLCEDEARSWLPTQPGHGIFEEHLFAFDGEQIHGGYILRHLDLSINGHSVPAAGFGQPTSEGILNFRYRLVGPQLVRDAVKRQPLLFGTGMGGWDEPVTRLLRSSGWRISEVPFFLKVLKPERLLRTASAARSTAARRIFADVTAATGLARVGAWMANFVLTRRPRRQDETVDVVEEFGPWADEVWESSRKHYALVGRRDSSVLNLLYPPGDRRFQRLRFTVSNRPVGWAVIMDSQQDGHAHLGGARAGLIVDCLATPDRAESVISQASRALQARGVDLVRSHQTHPAWARALRRAGFLPAPSYFLLGLSPELGALLDEIDPSGDGAHINRGDGDGPRYL